MKGTLDSFLHGPSLGPATGLTMVRMISCYSPSHSLTYLLPYSFYGPELRQMSGRIKEGM